MKPAVFANSFFTESGSVYNIALVEIDHAKNRYAVYTQFGQEGQKLVLKRGQPTAFAKANAEYDALVARKLTPNPDSPRFLVAHKAALIEDLELIGEEEAANLALLRSQRTPVALTEIDLNDPALIACLEEDMWIGVPFNNDAHTLAKVGQEVLLDGVALPSTHPYFVAAHEIGGEFRFAGYKRTSQATGEDAFCAFDMVDDLFHSYDFGKRIQTMANLLAETEIESIQLAQFVVGTENKKRAAEQIGTIFSHIRFMRMDHSFTAGKVRIFPPL